MIDKETSKVISSPISRRSNVSFQRVSQIASNYQNELDDYEQPKEVKTLMDLEFFKMIQNFLGEKGVNKHTKNMRLGSFRRNQYIIKPEKNSEIVYVIMRGEVDVTDTLTGEIETISEGFAFGDLRYKGRGLKHNIAQAMTDCMIYLIDKEDYFILIQEIEIEKINRFSFYLRSFEVFQSVHKSILEKIYSQKSDMNFLKNEVVFREGDDADGIYFIHKGEFLVTKKGYGEQNKLREVERQVDILKKENELLVAGLIGKYNTKSSFFKQASSNLELKRTISEANNTNLNSKNNMISNPSKPYELIILKDNDMIGDLEIFITSEKKRQLTVTCRSDSSEVYYISSENINKILNQSLREKFIILAKKKSDMYNNRFKTGRDLIQILASTKLNPIPIIKKGKIIIKEKVENVTLPYKKLNANSTSVNIPTFGNSELSSIHKQGIKVLKNENQEYMENSKIESVNYLRKNPNKKYIYKNNDITIKPILSDVFNFTKSDEISPINFPKDRENTTNDYLKTYNTTREIKSLQTKAVTKSYLIQDKLQKSFCFKAQLNVTTYPNIKFDQGRHSQKNNASLDLEKYTNLRKFNGSFLDKNLNKTNSMIKRFTGELIPSAQYEMVDRIGNYIKIKLGKIRTEKIQKNYVSPIKSIKNTSFNSFRKLANTTKSMDTKSSFQI